MKYLAILLLVGVVVRHNTAYEVASLTGISPPGAFYVLGGLWESILCAVVLIIAWQQRQTVYRSAILGAMAIGIIEGLQMSVCRACIKNMADVPKGVNICDYLTGFPVGATVASLYLIILIWILGKELKK